MEPSATSTPQQELLTAPLLPQERSPGTVDVQSQQKMADPSHGLSTETQSAAFSASSVEGTAAASIQTVRPTGSFSFSCGRLLDDRKKLEESAVPVGALLSPLRQRHAPPVLRRTPVTCSCGTVINRFCVVEAAGDKLKWVCVLCRQENVTDVYGTADEGTGLASLPSIYPEFSVDVVDYIDPTDQPLPVLGGLHPTFAIVIDENIPKEELNNVVAAIESVLRVQSEQARVALITFSNVASVYELTTSGIVSAETFSGRMSPSVYDGARLVNRRNSFLASLDTCKQQFFSALKVLVASAKVQNPRNKRLYRCLGAAVELALALLVGDNAEERQTALGSGNTGIGGRILVFLNGEPNYGPGAIDEDDKQLRMEAMHYYRDIAVDAANYDVGIDLLCGGLTTFHVRELQQLVACNGGMIMLIRDFATATLSTNLDVLLSRTRGRKGCLNIRCSHPLALTHIIGPAGAKSRKPSSASTHNGNECPLAGVHQEHCFAVYFEILEDILTAQVYFQFVLRFINLQNQRITRVGTAMLPTTSELGEFWNSMDTDVASILIAKKVILLSRKVDDPHNQDVLDSLDSHVRELMATSKSLKLHPNDLTFTMLSQKLFLLRQGPLLGPILQHRDDIDNLRCFFLNSGFDICKHIMEPTLLLVQPNGVFLKVSSLE